MSLEGNHNTIEKFFFAFALIYILSIMGRAADSGVLNPVVIKVIPVLIASGVLFIAAAVGKFVNGGVSVQYGVNKAAGGSGAIPGEKQGIFPRKQVLVAAYSIRSFFLLERLW